MVVYNADSIRPVRWRMSPFLASFWLSLLFPSIILSYSSHSYFSIIGDDPQNRQQPWQLANTDTKPPAAIDGGAAHGAHAAIGTGRATGVSSGDNAFAAAPRGNVGISAGATNDGATNGAHALPSSSSRSSSLSPSARVRSPPRKMSATQNPVFFVHVGKAGGTSVDGLLGPLLRKAGRRYQGHKHYDWSWIERRGNPDADADAITFLRHPVARCASQFHFGKTLRWAKRRRAAFLNQTLEEYVRAPGSWRQPIQDGMAGLTFLAGSLPPSKGWIATDGEDTAWKRYLRTNATATALQAAKNLDRTVWFGLLEEVPRSMQMLQRSLDLRTAPTFPANNVNKRREDRGARPLSAETVSRIEAFMPGDLWLYEYARRVFEARWSYFVAGGAGETVYEHPALPPYPLPPPSSSRQLSS